MRSIAAVVLLLVQGCLFQNIGSEERLRDSVIEMNDQLRWSRMDLAIAHVSPSFRRRFVESHRSWGRTVQIADMELGAVEMVDGRERASSVITFRWYSSSTMTLRETILRQRWERTPRGYALVGEQILGGDESLLPPPPEAPAPDEAEASADAEPQSDQS